MEQAVSFEQSDNILIIRFNRTEIRSPLSIFVLELLSDAMVAAGRDKALEKIIFTGRNDVFASGADLREIARVDEKTAGEFARRGQKLMRQIEEARPLTIAAVNGFCFGGALDLALACRRRIASPNALFAHPGVDLGIMTGWGGTQRLPRLIGEAAALEMFLTAKRVRAGEALAIGLVDSIDQNPLDKARLLEISDSVHRLDNR